MCELKNIGKVFTSKSVGPGPSSYKKIIYRAAVSQMLRNTGLVELRLRPLLVLHIHISPSTSYKQRNCASWASQPQKSVTLRPQLGGETTKSIRDMWWHWVGETNLSGSRKSLKKKASAGLKCMGIEV
jgi:hypothetical protein